MQVHLFSTSVNIKIHVSPVLITLQYPIFLRHHKPIFDCGVFLAQKSTVWTAFKSQGRVFTLYGSVGTCCKRYVFGPELEIYTAKSTSQKDNKDDVKALSTCPFLESHFCSVYWARTMDNVAPLCCLLQVSSSMASCNDVGMGGREVLRILFVFLPNVVF